MAKIYPSQKRYQEKNPAITFRISKHEREKIEKLVERTGFSISELVRNFFSILKKGSLRYFIMGFTKV